MQELCKDRNAVDAALCESLVLQGADVGFNENGSFSPLLGATRHGLPAVVSAILDRGGDVNGKDNWGWTALMIASKAGYADLAELLIGRGADIHAVTKKGETPFSMAKDSGAKATEQVLIMAERKRQQAEADSLVAQFQDALEKAHIAQEPIRVGHALRLVRRDMR